MTLNRNEAHEIGVRNPIVDDIDHSQLDRLDATIPEPDDSFLHSLDQSLDAQAAAKRAAAEAVPSRHALVVLIGEDRAGQGGSGELVAELLAEDRFIVDAVVDVAERKSEIRHAIETGVVGGADLVITIGGTGFGPRDRAPEATRKLLDRRIPGIAEAIRSSGLAANNKDAALSRGLAGISGSTVVVNIAGSRGAIRDGMATLGPLVNHVLDELGV